MQNKFFYGAPLLLGNNTVPGVQLSAELKENIPIILKACKDWGLDFYPTVVQMLTYDEISEIAAYGGFPVRFPHWSFGMEYEELQRGYEFGMHRIYEMVINCCELDAPVLTMRGTLPASSVLVGDKVVIGSDTRNVVAVKRQKASKTKKIILKNGQTLVCTPNHKWKIISDQGLVWKKTSDIKAGDVVVGTDSYEKTWNAPKIDWSSNLILEKTRSNIRNRLKKIYPPKNITHELAELLGVLGGDGSVGVKGSENNLSVAIGKKNHAYVKHVANLFSKVFGIDPEIYEKPNCFNVTLCSKQAVDFLDHIGFHKGSTYKNKRVPDIIWKSPAEYRASYVRGLFDTDGYVTSYVGFSCYNKYFANDIQVMLTEMGIQTNLKMLKNGVGKEGDQKFIYVLHLKGIFADKKFSQRIGFSIGYKQQLLHDRCQRKYCRSRGIKVPYVTKRLIDWSKEKKITTYINLSLGYSVKNFEKFSVGINALASFVQRAEGFGYEVPDDIKQLVSNPLFEVCSVIDGDVVETIDIALDHDAHDFIAYGLITHNTNPCYIYCLNSNTLGDNLTVVAHATGHNDFFKNNIHFSATNTDMLNVMANHGSRIRKYMSRWGSEKVTTFIDHVMRIETMVDGAKAWRQKTIREKHLRDKRKYRNPKRLHVDSDRLYMDPYINTKDFKEKENIKNNKRYAADELGIFTKSTRDIFGFLKENAPLKPWQQDIMSMLYEEALYFFPQRQTKTLNEGWASTVDHVIMAEQGFIGLGQKSHDCGIFEYAIHKMGVLGGRYSTNPYKLGYTLLADIRERYDKGRFGTEYEECQDMHKKENWDTNTQLGKEKIFEVRNHYDDFTLINEFFTEEFCRKHEYFEWKKQPNGEFVIASRDFKNIKDKLLRRHINGSLPDIRLEETNFKGRGYLFLQHYSTGQRLYDPYVREVLTSVRSIWGNDVYLATKNPDGTEYIYECHGVDSSKDIKLKTKEGFIGADEDERE